jgi:hypothetical protein
MRERITRATATEAPSPLVERGEARARVAKAMLTDPRSGTTRMQYVGLPEAEAVHLVVAARALGLDAETTRSPGGQLCVTLSMPAPTASLLAMEPLAPERTRDRAATALRAAVARVAHHLTGRLP